MLPGDLSIFELDDHDDGDFDSPTRGWYAWKHPWHLDRVGKLVNQFIDNAIFSNCPCDRHDFRVRRLTRNEIGAVKMADFIIPDATSHHGHMIDEGIRG